MTDHLNICFLQVKKIKIKTLGCGFDCKLNPRENFTDIICKSDHLEEVHLTDRQTQSQSEIDPNNV